jgi:diguanylate cyclase (GGDEF)-like protein
METVARVIASTGLLLEHFSRLAANDTAASAALVAVFRQRNGRDIRQAAHGLSRQGIAVVADIDRIAAGAADWTVVPDLARDARFAQLQPTLAHLGYRFLVHINLLSSGGERIGFICLLDETPRPALNETQTASLHHIAAMVVSDRKREQRHQHLMHVANRALRVDAMMRAVSDAASCADALNQVLAELCVFHGATVGRVWQMTQPDAPLLEIGCYLPSGNDAAGAQAAAPADRLCHATVDAIRRNRPQTLNAPLLDTAGKSARNAVAGQPAGDALGYVCVPIWVQQQRYGIALTFAADSADLDLVVADITSLADTIRPALFRKVTEERIRFAAHHDDLTQLSNRLLFQERLHQALATARSGGHGFALLYMDLDGFKRVNDTSGHEVGDRLLVGVAERLRLSLRETDTVARMGGDEFAIIQPFGSESSSAASLAERLLETIARPFDLDGTTALIGVSIGIAFYPQHGDTPDILIRHADIALYRAKQAGRNTFRVYGPELQAVRQDRLPIEHALREAVDRNALSLAFQPVCDSATMRIVGFEALLRWDHPELGAVEPDRFIPVAESTGLIFKLGLWTLEAACAEAMLWDPPVMLSANLSPAQFRQRDLPEQIAAILARTGLPAARLELEVTEGLLLEGTESVLRTMRAIQALGVRILLDDFGTGYASLSYLRQFPFDGIKIDQSFVRDLCCDRIALTIVESVLALGSRLDLGVIAEGVETEHELGVLRDLGCRFIQGYLSGRPCPAPEARALLRQSAGREDVKDVKLDTLAE